MAHAVRRAHVSAKNGALVRAGVELETELVGDPLATGTECTVEDEATSSRGVRRLRVTSPTAGWLSRKVVKLAAPRRGSAGSTTPRTTRPPPTVAPPPRPRDFDLPPMPSNHPCPLQRISPGRRVATVGLG